MFFLIISILITFLTIKFEIKALALIPALLVLFFTLANPFHALLFFIFCFFHPLIPYIIKISGGIALVSFGNYFFLKKRIHLDFSSFLFFAFITAVFISGILNNSLPGKTNTDFFNNLFYFFLYIVILNTVDSKKRLKTVILLLIFSGILQALMGLLEFFTVKQLFNFTYNAERYYTSKVSLVRATGSQFDPNIYDLYILYTIPFIFGIIPQLKSTVRKGFMLILGVVSIGGILVGLTRSVMFSMVLFAVVYSFFPPTKKKLAFFLATIMLSGAFLFISPKGKSIVKRFESLKGLGSIESSYNRYSSVMVRYRVYSAVGHLINEYPFFGIGGGNFYDMSYSMNPYALKQDPPGNIFANAAMNAGLIGLSCYIILLFVTWKNLSQSEKTAKTINDLEMFNYIRLIKYAFIMCFISLQTMYYYFAFPVIISIGLSGAIKRMVSESPLKEDALHDIPHFAAPALSNQ